MSYRRVIGRDSFLFLVPRIWCGYVVAKVSVPFFCSAPAGSGLFHSRSNASQSNHLDRLIQVCLQCGYSFLCDTKSFLPTCFNDHDEAQRTETAENPHVKVAIDACGKLSDVGYDLVQSFCSSEQTYQDITIILGHNNFLSGSLDPYYCSHVSSILEIHIYQSAECYPGKDVYLLFRNNVNVQ